MRIDSTYEPVRFAYLDASRRAKLVTTLEEQEYPHYYHKTIDCLRFVVSLCSMVAGISVVYSGRAALVRCASAISLGRCECAGVCGTEKRGVALERCPLGSAGT
jgi:hypothetical protein